MVAINTLDDIAKIKIKDIKALAQAAPCAHGLGSILHLDHDAAAPAALCRVASLFEQDDNTQCVHLVIGGKEAGCLSRDAVLDLVAPLKIPLANLINPPAGVAYRLVFGAPGDQSLDLSVSDHGEVPTKDVLGSGRYCSRYLCKKCTHYRYVLLYDTEGVECPCGAQMESIYGFWCPICAKERQFRVFFIDEDRAPECQKHPEVMMKSVNDRDTPKVKDTPIVCPKCAKEPLFSVSFARPDAVLLPLCENHPLVSMERVK